MSCRVCGRTICTESFHSLEEQERAEQLRQVFASDEAVAQSIERVTRDHEDLIVALADEEEPA